MIEIRKGTVGHHGLTQDCLYSTNLVDGKEFLVTMLGTSALPLEMGVQLLNQLISPAPYLVGT